MIPTQWDLLLFLECTCQLLHVQCHLHCCCRFCVSFSIAGLFTLLDQVRKGARRKRVPGAAESMEAPRPNQVLELIIVLCLSPIGDFHFPRPVGLVMQRNSRLLVCKTTAQNFSLKLMMPDQKEIHLPSDTLGGAAPTSVTDV